MDPEQHPGVKHEQDDAEQRRRRLASVAEEEKLKGGARKWRDARNEQIKAC